MKKNPRDYEVNGKMYAYILDSISSDDVDVESMSDKERIEFALDMFYDEIYKNDRRRMSTLEKLTYWISGLCSTVSVTLQITTLHSLARSGVIAEQTQEPRSLYIHGLSASPMVFCALQRFTAWI